MNIRLFTRFQAFLLLIGMTSVCLVRAWSAETAADISPKVDKGVKIVFLGTSPAIPNPDRQSESLVIGVNGRLYVVDAGTSLVRQAAAEFYRGVPDLRVDALRTVFITHLHSDHTLGLPDLMLIPWLMGRNVPLEIFGPPGIKNMADGILVAYREDISKRANRIGTDGIKINVHEIEPGPIYQDENVKVRAFAVHHGEGWLAVGYRFDADGKSIVVSGDTGPADSVVEACNGCDVLIHEATSGTGEMQNRGVPMTSPAGPSDDSKCVSQGHTCSVALGQIAAKAKAKMLIVTHWLPLGTATQDDLVQGIRQNYNGPVMVARDLDVVSP